MSLCNFDWQEEASDGLFWASSVSLLSLYCYFVWLYSCNCLRKEIRREKWIVVYLVLLEFLMVHRSFFILVVRLQADAILYYLYVRMSKNTEKIPKFCDPYSLPDIFILNLNYLLEIQKSSALFIHDSMS